MAADKDPDSKTDDAAKSAAASGQNNAGSISLDAIVAEQAKKADSTSVAGAPVPNAPTAKAAAEKAPAGVSLDAVDALLAVEDPAFAASMNELKSTPMGDAEIDSIDLQSVDKASAPALRPRWLNICLWPFEAIASGFRGVIHGLKGGVVPFVKASARALLAAAVQGAKQLLGLLKAGAGYFASLPKFSKVLLLAVLALGFALLAVVKMTFKGAFLPEISAPFLSQFGPIADESFEYEDGDPMEEFQNPLLHPESVVLFDRIVVNLKHGDDTNPMGMFEFYIEASSREGAIELKRREVESRDVISRTLEQLTYPEISTDQGKHKLKVILRKNLNELLTKGRVRRIYFKTMVLKP